MAADVKNGVGLGKNEVNKTLGLRWHVAMGLRSTDFCGDRSAECWGLQWLRSRMTGL
jgi:hypothetical protein